MNALKRLAETPVFENVYRFDWYDGPRQGVADFGGRPHIFESEWQDLTIIDDTFLLSPIDAQTFAWAVEEWDIWRRWETAFHQGKTSRETHPALPHERERYEELGHQLSNRMVVDRSCAFRRMAEFRVKSDATGSVLGIKPLEVRWIEIPSVVKPEKSE